MTQMLEDMNIPFMALIKNDAPLREYSNISYASGCRGLGNDDISEDKMFSLLPYQDTVDDLMTGYLPEAQSKFAIFVNRVLTPGEGNGETTKEQLVALVEHALGMVFLANAELTEAKTQLAAAEEKIEVQEQSKVAFLASERIPFSHLVEAVANESRDESLYGIIHSSYGEIVRDAFDDNMYAYRSTVGKDEATLEKIDAIEDPVNGLCIILSNQKTESTNIADMQEYMLDLTQKVVENNVPGVLMLPVVEAVAMKAFAKKLINS